jgi:hypothetical protein
MATALHPTKGGFPAGPPGIRRGGSEGCRRHLHLQVAGPDACLLWGTGDLKRPKFTRSYA